MAVCSKAVVVVAGEALIVLLMMIALLKSSHHTCTVRAFSSTGRIILRCTTAEDAGCSNSYCSYSTKKHKKKSGTPNSTRRRQSLLHHRQLSIVSASGLERQPFLQHRQLSILFASGSESDDGGSSSDNAAAATTPTTTAEPMENLYREWNLDSDKLLWENRHQSTAELASLLGRGLRGVESRLAKLKDVNSPAYERLFAAAAKTDDDDHDNNNGKRASNEKLVPVSEVLRRIEWDPACSGEDFSVLHYDRVDDAIVESPFSASNNKISGPKKRLVDALPEHRIVAVKYKERIVWDREKRIDHFFANEGIASVIDNYDEWKQKRDAAVEWNRQRQREVSGRIQQVLGFDRYKLFQDLSSTLRSNAKDPAIPMKTEVETFVRKSIDLFRQAREDRSAVLAPIIIPRTDYEALDTISELVALLPDANLRPLILEEIVLSMRRFEGKNIDNPVTKELPEIREDEITETFVRGSGPGGQKINKTASKVLLVHEPTQVRVECQDTRSLQQNRKIARKRLRLKLDEHINGSQSRTSMKAKAKASKKAKAKARSRARQRRKKAATEGTSED